MDVTPLIPTDKKIITGYGNGMFHINKSPIQGNIILLPNNIIHWDASIDTVLTLQAFDALAPHKEGISLLLIGTGEKHLFLPPHIAASLKHSYGFTAETMTTGAACRTYNVLLAEGRNCAAALIAI